MNKPLIAVHLARLAPDVPPFNILAMIDHREAADILADPRNRSEAAAEMIWERFKARWEDRSRKAVAS